MKIRHLTGYAPIAGMVALSLFAGWAAAGLIGIAVMSVGLALVWTRAKNLRLQLVARHVAAEPRRKPLSPDFRQKVDRLGSRAGLAAPPQLGFVEGAPNAFAWQRGAGNAEGVVAVVIAESLHDLLSERQLLAVVAHELAHLKMGDHQRLLRGELLGRFSMIASVVALIVGAGAFIVWGQQLVPNWVWWVLAFGPTAMSILHHVASRQSEFHADAEAARLTGDGAALSQALARIRFATTGGADLKSAISEYTGLRGRGWWRTHPSVEDRIDRLQKIRGRGATDR